MFTGLIEELATLVGGYPFAGGRRFRVRATCAAEGGLSPGDSVALDGVCLTVESCSAAAAEFTVAAVTETLRCTTAGEWIRGRRLHLERAVGGADRLGGHLVQGHVDGQARVVHAGREGRSVVLTLTLPAALRRYVVPKGSLAVDGVSLTVAQLRGGTCRLYIIPETLARTRIGSYRVGERVNLEVDLVAKYVESLLDRRSQRR